MQNHPRQLEVDHAWVCRPPSFRSAPDGDGQPRHHAPRGVHGSDGAAVRADHGPAAWLYWHQAPEP
eukprot:3268409-Pyramimonas_sp.AAC.1